MTKNNVRTAMKFPLLTLVFAALSFGQGAANPERIVVKAMIGQAEVQSVGTAKWRPLRTGMPVQAGWNIRTFVESTVDLEFANGTVIKVGENSVMVVNRHDENAKTGQSNTKVGITTGQMWANVKKITGQKSDFQFETPTASASIRGTRLGLNVGRNGGTAIDVYEGAVAVRRRGENRETMVTTKMRAVLEPGGKGVGLVNMAAAAAQNAGQPAMVDPFAATDSSNADSTAAKPDSTVAPADSLKPPVDSTVAPADSVKPPVDTTAAPADSVKPPVGSETTPADSVKAPSDTVKTGEQEQGAAAEPADTVVPVVQTQPKDTADAADDAEQKPQAVALRLQIVAPADNAVVTETPAVVKGMSTPGATVTVAGRDATLGADGSFNALVELSAGGNVISVSAMLGGESKSADINLVYRPPLTLNVWNVTDNMEALAKDMTIDVDVSEGAQYSVNGKTGANAVTLVEGKNQITVRAWDPWGGVAEKAFTVTYRKPVAFELSVTAPAEGLVVRTPMIPVSGSTVPGAKVLVNGAEMRPNASGFFTGQIQLPDEPQEYTIEISARYGDEEKTEERTVVYEPKYDPLQLVITSPGEGQVISQRAVTVTGKVSVGAVLVINGRSIPTGSGGVINTDIAVTEREIGDFTIDISATLRNEEVSKSITVAIDGASPQINTSTPSLMVQGHGQQATRSGSMPVQVTDRTPDDHITLYLENNGSVDEYELASGSRQPLQLDPGKNAYSVRARDRAGNQAAPVKGSIYYLPGPLQIDINEPSENPWVLWDLPPQPRGVNIPRLRVEVELDDGIGNVPETIKACRIIGNGQQVALQAKGNRYVFEGDIKLVAGRNIYTIQAEDIAGNVATQTLTVDIR